MSQQLSQKMDSSVVSNVPDPDESKSGKKRKCKVLEEDTYVDKIDKIVERDFFPDLRKLKAQLAYQKALEENDISEMNRLKEKFCGNLTGIRPDTIRSERGTFETPINSVTIDVQEEEPVKTCVEDSTPNMSLDKFLRKYTSEDNSSFEEIQEETHRRERARVPWLHVDESIQRIKYEKSLELPSIENQAVTTRDTQNLITWPYKNKNSVMFNPEGLGEQEIPKALEVVHKNTRFVKKPFSDTQSKAAIASAAALQCALNDGKVGPDGKTIEGPVINGYEMVKMTPSPGPSTLNATPLMTWGEIDGTPFRLDDPDVSVEPIAPGTPQFRIPELPDRDRLGISLADKVSRMYRDRRRDALKHVTSKIKSPYNETFGSPRSNTGLLNRMSPAARRLATVQLGLNKVRDPKLQAAYSPARSPFATPSPSRSRRTPSVAGSPRTPSTSLTDNLLKLSKK